MQSTPTLDSALPLDRFLQSIPIHSVRPLLEVISIQVRNHSFFVDIGEVAEIRGPEPIIYMNGFREVRIRSTSIPILSLETQLSLPSTTGPYPAMLLIIWGGQLAALGLDKIGDIEMVPEGNIQLLAEKNTRFLSTCTLEATIGNFTAPVLDVKKLQR